MLKTVKNAMLRQKAQMKVFCGSARFKKIGRSTLDDSSAIKTPECGKKTDVLHTICSVFKYHSHDAHASTSSAMGEVLKRAFAFAAVFLFSTTAQAKVCFLPDADACADDDITTICDGIDTFTEIGSASKFASCAHKIAGHEHSQECRQIAGEGTCYKAYCIYASQQACEDEADSNSSKNRHYFCEQDEDVGCWYMDSTPCSESSSSVGCRGYDLSAPKSGKTCDSCTKNWTYYNCTEKGLPYTTYDTETVYDCKDIITEERGCDSYKLSSEISGYNCESCTKDVYQTNYEGEYNYTGKGSTVYKCSKTEESGCGSEYNLSLDEKTEKENSGKYKCYECTPTSTTTNDDGTTSTTDGTTVYKCVELTSKDTTCPSDYISADAAEKMKNEDTCVTCNGCTPHTDYYEDGTWVSGTSGATVYSCSKPSCDGKKRASDCGLGTEFVPAGECSKFSDGTPCGDCIDCNDENNPINKCFGKYTCIGGGRHPVGEVTCTCGNVKYYDRCEVEETCDTEGYWEAKKCESGDSYWCYYSSAAYKRGYGPSGYYLVGEKCRKVDLTYVDWYALCDSSYYDVLGNRAPAYGMTRCDNDKGIGDAVECGGNKYFKECADKCTTDDYWDHTTTPSTHCYATDGTLLNGYYYVKDKCDKENGKKVIYYEICNASFTDCAGNTPPAQGMKTCEGDNGVGDPVECGGYKYFKECADKCNMDSFWYGYKPYKSCQATIDKSYTEKYGNYYVDEKCTKQNGDIVYYYYTCNGEYLDCNGGTPPAQGLKKCETGQFLGGKIVECGGYKYAEYCMAECNYEDDAKSCSDKGKDFNPICRDEDDKEWGTCVDKAS